MPRDLTDLTDLHLLILGALWAAGDATIADIHAAIRHRSPASTKTIATLLGRLEQRGIVSHRLVGREGVYRAHVARRDVLVARMGGVLGALFAAEERWTRGGNGGNGAGAAAIGAAAIGDAVVDGDGPRPDDAARLRDLLRRAERDLDGR